MARAPRVPTENPPKNDVDRNSDRQKLSDRRQRKPNQPDFPVSAMGGVAGAAQAWRFLDDTQGCFSASRPVWHPARQALYV